jgi:6-phosphogluconolactonase (cycloisomerase 2 family)
VKTIIESYSRLSRGLFYTLLLGIASFCAMPRSALAAQPPLLYVAQSGNSTISEYNASKGSVIDATFIANPSGYFYLNGPTGLVVSGKFLFVASSGNNTVRQYEASGSGTWFISGFATPTGIAVSPDGKFLFVADWNGTQAIGRYDADTGAGSMWQTTATQFDLGNPSALAVSADSKTLFVAHWQQGSPLFNNAGHGSVSTYNANTGTVDKDNFITGLSFPSALAVSADGKTLFVVNNTQSPEGFISTYNTSGGLTNANLITGLPSPKGIALSDNTLYVIVNTGGTGGVRTYTTSGKLLNPDFITNLNQPYGLAIKPAP